VKKVPTEIFNQEEFIQLSSSADYCTMKRSKRSVKLKLRTKRKMFTLKLKTADADEIVKKLKCDILEA
jgi:large subunit ribosomal protein L38e